MYELGLHIHCSRFLSFQKSQFIEWNCQMAVIFRYKYPSVFKRFFRIIFIETFLMGKRFLRIKLMSIFSPLITFLTMITCKALKFYFYLNIYLFLLRHQESFVYFFYTVIDSLDNDIPIFHQCFSF